MAQVSALSLMGVAMRARTFVAKSAASSALTLTACATSALTAAERRLLGIKTEKSSAQQKLAEAICCQLAFVSEQFGAGAGISTEALEALDRAKRGEQGIITERTVPAVERVRAICFELAKLAANV